MVAMASAEELEGKSLTSKSDDENTDPRMSSLIAAKTIVVYFRFIFLHSIA